MAIGWQHYELVMTETHEEGVLQIPVAAPDGTPAEIVKQHASAGKRTVRFVAASTAQRAADLPELPAALAFIDAVLERREIVSQSPVIYDKGLYLYVVWGTYTYAMRNARPPDAPFPIPNLPPSLSALGDAQKLFPAAKFRRFLDTGQFAPVKAVTL